jgi:hypothetical protein
MIKGKKTEAGPANIWRDIGDNDRIMDTDDGYHAHVYRRSSGWIPRVTDPVTKQFVDLPPHQSDSEAKNAAMQAIAEARRKRNGDGRTA